MYFPLFEQRPIIVAIAGPNGAGKTTFYDVHLRTAGLQFINADVVARELDVEPYVAARMADSWRRNFVARRESFIFETVFSDPVGDKLAFLKGAAEDGYTVVLCFVGIASPELAECRVALRVSEGGHDVPNEKIYARFPRTMKNLERAILDLPNVFVFDNSDWAMPMRHVATFEKGNLACLNEPASAWLEPLAKLD